MAELLSTIDFGAATIDYQRLSTIKEVNDYGERL